MAISRNVQIATISVTLLGIKTPKIRLQSGAKLEIKGKQT